MRDMLEGGLTMNDECEGCIDNRPNDSGVYNGMLDCSKKQLLEPCPCRICLVKVMCNKACEEYIEYATRHKKELIILNRGLNYKEVDI